MRAYLNDDVDQGMSHMILFGQNPRKGVLVYQFAFRELFLSAPDGVFLFEKQLKEPLFFKEECVVLLCFNMFLLIIKGRQRSLMLNDLSGWLSAEHSFIQTELEVTTDGHPGRTSYRFHPVSRFSAPTEHFSLERS